MRIGIVGAGAIGGFLAAELAPVAEVVLVQRRAGPRAVPRPFAVTVGGRALELPPSVQRTDRFEALADVDACLVAVKSADTEEVARRIAEVTPPRVIVVSLQNGLNNGARLRASLGARASGGVVTYNVQIDDEGRRRQASSGCLIAERMAGEHGRSMAALAETFRRAGERFELVADVDRVLAGKLLVNLNNGVCAATGLSIAASLRDRDARRCFARCLREGRAVMKAAGLRPARVVALPPSALALALELPDALVMRLARGLVSMDERARSSTLQDLDRGRPTEIDELNGAIVQLGSAPANAVVTEIVKEHERRAMAGEQIRFVTPAALRARIERARRA